MSNPRVSLIIPAYNEELYIGECLDHILEKSGSRFYEILVINNGSTDKTEEIALSREGVRVINESRQEVTRARERGFREAQGEILAFVDADVRMPSGWYEMLVREFGADPNLACLSGPYVYYDFPAWLRLVASLYWHLLAIPAGWLVGYLAIGGNMVLTRDALEKMGGFDTRIEFYGDDADTVRRARVFGKVKFKPSFRMHTSGRRFYQQGIVNTAYQYMLNFFSVAVRHQPVTSEYQNFR